MLERIVNVKKKVGVGTFAAKLRLPEGNYVSFRWENRIYLISLEEMETAIKEKRGTGEFTKAHSRLLVRTASHTIPPGEYSFVKVRKGYRLDKKAA